MKLLKSLAIVSLASLFAFSSAQADTKKTSSKPQTKQQQTKKQSAKPKQTQKKQTTQKKNSNVKKAAVATGAAAATGAAVSQDKALKQFNDAFGIKMTQYQLENDKDGKMQLHLTYELTNKGKKSVKAVKFIGAFVHQNQASNKQEIVYAQEIPLTFNTPLKSKEHTSIDIRIPFDTLPEASRPYFTNANIKLGVVNGAQVLVFSDNTGIVLK